METTQALFEFLTCFKKKLDQNAIVNAPLNGHEDDLVLKGSEYNTCIIILYIGYLCDHTPSNILVFFLRIVETPFYPGAMYILSIFYTRKEIVTPSAVSFAGLIAAETFSTLGNKHSMHECQWLFIIEGVASFEVAIVAFWMLPHKPLNTRYHLFLTAIGSLDFNTATTLVLTGAPSLVVGVVGIFISISSGKFNERTWHITNMMKKAASHSIINAVSMASFIYTPHSYPKSDGSKYVIAMSGNACFALRSIVSAWVLRIWL
ncbi:uncharacterized protein BDR25DRAFT_331775 [Lindgomyces ingoldianus]|uniref:Uncharacterized protein n=1 Tax=Lindgomyces ingoldianus TaxID=673940 RepID=A0ACB6R815_9PLEO|nr:uncharacterized protein BDR25DRAFT_331775 [Lindgomyces ingoldianus]KAF2475232.1 hypothetical protein BDR25DRAFT_331775 [Lindgomyces ingoldianus]